MESAPRSTVRVAATSDGIRRAADALDAFMAEQRPGMRPPWQLAVALDEVLANLVHHAVGDLPNASIEIVLSIDNGEFRVAVLDDGPPHNPLEAAPPDTTSPLDARQPGGLGVHLLRELVERLEYTRRENRNCLAFVHKLDSCSESRPMEIAEHRENGILVVAPSGRIDSTTSDTLDRVLSRASDGGERHAVVDFGSVEYISSAGLRVLLVAAKRMGTGRLVLCALPEPVRQVFDLAGFLRLFAVEGSRAAAIARLAGTV